MYCYKLNNSYTTYVSFAYLNDCIKASANKHTPLVKAKPAEVTVVASHLPKNTRLIHKVFGQGKVLSTDSSGIMTVLFREKTARFMYPDAVKAGHLVLAQ